MMTAKRPPVLALMRAVFWSFFGVRKRAQLESDMAELKLVHVIVAGIIGALLFVFTLLVVVKLVTS
jgi:hypothetical protein